MNDSMHRLARRLEFIGSLRRALSEREYAAAERVRNEMADRLRQTEERLRQVLTEVADLREAGDWYVLDAFARRLEQLQGRYEAEWQVRAEEAEGKRSELALRHREAETWKSLRIRLDEEQRGRRQRAWQAELDEHVVMREARRSWKSSDLR
ncbi:hypothetical protein [Alicyclobacillus fructus]|uniref:hypothetical protein n=1 Tax=Alicyclobacillus fructus TaxID=2816082 RepID=UPI001A8D5180|nr:hypothetical protein [Alicyclobacillus fructus]